MSKKFIYLLSFVLLLVMTTNIVQAGVDYKDPQGGWRYIYTGDQAEYGFGNNWALDSQSAGISTYWVVGEQGTSVDESIIGVGDPGGIMTITQGDVTFLRMQDCGIPGTYEDNALNAKFYWGHDLTNDGLDSDTAKNILQNGMTLTFRARIPTYASGGPLDDLYKAYALMDPCDGNSPWYDPNGPCYPDYPQGDPNCPWYDPNDPNDANYPDYPDDPVPWPDDGSGYGPHDSGKDIFTVVCFPTINPPYDPEDPQSGDHLSVAFGLLVPQDSNEDIGEDFLAGRQGLVMNCLNTSNPSTEVDIFDTEGEAWVPEGELNLLELDDVTQWHEFWINVEYDTSGGGSHKVTVYVDGSYEPQVFHITAATHDAGPLVGTNHIGLGLGMTNLDGAIDIDFFGYKEGIYSPPSIQAVAPNPRNGETGVPREVMLSWTPGDYAPSSNGHRIYFDTDFADVNTGNAGGCQVYVASQSDPCYPDDDTTMRLGYGTTYYWRIDEYNVPDADFTNTGNVWQFTTDTYAYPLTYDDFNSVTAISTAVTDANLDDPNNTVDGSGLDVNDAHNTVSTDMWLSDVETPTTAWILYEFDKTYKLEKMWVWNYNNDKTLGINNAKIEYSRDGVFYNTLGATHTFNQATGLPEDPHNTVIDFQYVVAKYIKITANSNHGGGTNQYGLSEVRFFYVPLRASVPYPLDGQSSIDPTSLVLKWTAGREADEHDIYISEDEQEVIDGNKASPGPAYITTVNPPDTSFDASTLDLNIGTTYYWKVNEVNDIEIPDTEWDGDVWQLNTIEYFVVDNMDNYGDDDTLPWEPGGWIPYVWRDGWYISGQMPGNDTGSQVGHWNNLETEFSEDDIVRSGLSMPYYYENDGDNETKPVDTYSQDSLSLYSEATAKTTGDNSLNFMKDWVSNGAKAISLWFYGDFDNDVDPNTVMYLALEDGSSHVASVKYDASHDYNPNDVKEPKWREWNIDLSDFTPTVDLNDVDKIHIGFGDRDNPELNPGGKGIVYFEDIRLYPARCIPSLSRPTNDMDNDCDVDYGEIVVMGEHWLVEDYNGAGELILHWKFDENGGSIAADSSGKGHTGDINDVNDDPNTIWYDNTDAGRIGISCLDFNGLGANVIDDDANLYMDGLHGLTVSMWVKSEVTNTDNGFIVFDSIGDFPGEGDHRTIRYDSSGSTNGGDDIIKCGIATTRSFQDIETDSFRQTTDWQHVALTWTTGDKVKLYVNGMLENGYTNETDCVGTTTGYNAVIVGKGRDNGDYDEGWDGKVDDVQIYNYELSEAEIETVMTGATIGKKDDVYYPASPADLYSGAGEDPNVVNFRDYEVLVTLDNWLDDPTLWP